MNANLLAPGGGDSARLPVLLLAAAIAAAVAQSEVWASAVGTAAALYPVIVTGSQDRRN
ncbi:hypothetical protein HRW14_31730 [Streptomyces lunaelactis]|uniref:hypothetical protein n=1 Tax=Streptomyces lunaelactis TaxID=1535768 RepID=UPI001584AB0B|nr:hypothetical protein [Streptomyces lunaelactis]NUK54751.1 hypothetical protein [Streptomyces lunaelactis]NUK68458.1 hypothetical protein [Streptomyces lunaelactis]